MYIIEVEIAKGGKGPIGSEVKAPEGDYVHKRKTDPSKYTAYRTIKSKSEKWEVQSVLEPIKK